MCAEESDGWAKESVDDNGWWFILVGGFSRNMYNICIYLHVSSLYRPIRADNGL